MDNKDDLLDSLVKQMLEDLRRSNSDRISREKYEKMGHSKNEVRKAAEITREIWPILDKYGNFIETEDTIRKLQDLLQSSNRRVDEQDHRMQDLEKDKKEMEKLKKSVEELKAELESVKEKHEEPKNDKETLVNEVPSTKNVNVAEMENEIREKLEIIDELSAKVNESAETIRNLENQLTEKDGAFERLEREYWMLTKDFYDDKTNFEDNIVSQRNKFLKFFMEETVVVAILVIMLLVTRALNVITGDVIMIGRSLGATMINGILLVIGAVKRFPSSALHFLELHLTYFSHSLVSFMKPVVFYFVIVFIVFVLVGFGMGNRR